MNTSFPKALRLLSYIVIFAGTIVASIDLLNAVTPVIAIPATVVGAAAMQIAASLLEGRRHE